MSVEHANVIQYVSHFPVSPKYGCFLVEVTIVGGFEGSRIQIWDDSCLAEGFSITSHHWPQKVSVQIYKHTFTAQIRGKDPTE